MNNLVYLKTAFIYFGKPYKFIESARRMSARYVISHFLLVCCLLYIPVFGLLVNTQPYELYQRLFSLDFEGAEVRYHSDLPFSAEYLSEGESTIYVFEDYLVFADSGTIISAPSEYLSGYEDTSYSFEKLFDLIAVYNMYIPQFLLPILLLALAVVFVLQGLFYLIFAIFLGTFRLMSTTFPFGERMKIVIMSSMPVALVCAIAGIWLPAVHIIVFQMLNLLMLFLLSKRYDAKERALLLDS